MTPLLAASAAAVTAVGMLHDMLGAAVPVGLALLIVAVRASVTPAGAAAATYVVAAGALAVISGGAVALWPAAPLLVPLAALPFALPGWASGRVRRNGRPAEADATLVLIWLLVEAAWVHAAGVPAFRVGYAVAGTPLAPLAGLAGAGTVSAAAWLVALVLANAVRFRRLSDAGPVAVPAALLALAHLVLNVGSLDRPGSPVVPASFAGAAGPSSVSTRPLRLALVQTNVRAADVRVSLDWPAARTTLDERTLALLRSAAATGADVVVAPEAALRMSEGRPPSSSLPRFPGSAPVAVLAGALVRAPDRVRNAVVDLAAGGEIRYVKRHPVPVSERRFEAGERAEPITLGSLTIAASICYDLLFGREIRQDARRADLLVAVSDAAFAERSALPTLHLGVARLRAAETGTPLAFTTATGPTAVIDARGRVLARSRRLQDEVLEVEVALGAAEPPYARFGIEADGLVLAAAALLTVRRGVRPLGDSARRP